MFALGQKVTLEHLQLCLMMLFLIELSFGLKVELFLKMLVIAKNIKKKIKIFNLRSNILQRYSFLARARWVLNKAVLAI